MVFGHFRQRSYENTNILSNLSLHFARQDGQDGKNRKESHATKTDKIPKTKRRKNRVNDTLMLLSGLSEGGSDKEQPVFIIVSDCIQYLYETYVKWVGKSAF